MAQSDAAGPVSVGAQASEPTAEAKMTWVRQCIDHFLSDEDGQTGTGRSESPNR